MARTLIPALMVFLVGCAKSEQYGEPIQVTQTTNLGDVLSHPENYKDKVITVKGEIVTECPSGCWFEIKEGGAILYVDIGQKGLAIPQRLGREVTVEGKVLVDGRNVRFAGERLEIR